MPAGRSQWGRTCASCLVVVGPEDASRLSWVVGRGKNRGGRVSLPSRSAFAFPNT